MSSNYLREQLKRPIVQYQLKKFMETLAELDEYFLKHPEHDPRLHPED